MTKFIVTGFKRSGTTYLASILNSQKHIFCFEFNPFIFKNKKTKRELLSLNSEINSLFIFLGMKGPNLTNIFDYQKQEDAFIEFFHNKHKTLHAGFKVTGLVPTELNNLVKRGYKIIHIKRNIRDVFKSHLIRIGKNEKELSFELREYLEKFENFNLQSQKDKYLVVEYENLIKDKKNELKKLSSFLNYNVNGNVDLYHSFNKERYIFKNNSSFGDLESRDGINIENKYYNYINGQFDLYLSSYHLLKKLKRFILGLIKSVLETFK